MNPLFSLAHISNVILLVAALGCLFALGRFMRVQELRPRLAFKVWRRLEQAPIKVSFGTKLYYAANAFQPDWMGAHVRTFTPDSSVTQRWMVVKAGSTGQVKACAAAADQPIGICLDQYYADENSNIMPVGVILFGANKGLIPVLITVATTLGLFAYSDGTGCANGAPTTGSAQGSYYRIGQFASVEATGASTNLGAGTPLYYAALAPCVPVQVGVITATGATTVANIVTLLKLATTPQEVLFN